MGWTAEERAAMAAADAEIEADFRLTPEDLALALEIDREAVMEAKDRAARKADDRQKAYYEENRERIAAQQKAYYEENRERIAARKKAYREENRERIRAYERSYRDAHREEIN